LQREDAYYREAGCWRVLLEEELKAHPDASDCLYRIVKTAGSLLE
jgi:hypothetical protein